MVSRAVKDMGHYVQVGLGFHLQKEDYDAIVRASKALIAEWGTDTEIELVQMAMIEVAIHKRSSGAGSGRGWLRGLRMLAQTLRGIAGRSGR